MKNIKRYKSFLEKSTNRHPHNPDDEKLWQGVQHEYSIYDWFEDLKSFEWMTKPSSDASKVNINSIKSWTNHFIGDGWFEKISAHVDKIFNALEKADPSYINDRMIDIYDEFVPDKEKWTSRCVLYGDVENINKSDKESGKYNGIISIPTISTVNKTRTIIHIIKEIVNPTLNIGSGQNTKPLRSNSDEIYVTDKKYQCSFFNIKDYVVYNQVSKFYLEKKNKYDTSLFTNMYRPGIVINIGGYSSDFMVGKFNLGKLESKIDEVLPSILHDLDYKEVIFDQNRESRLYKSDTDIYDYTLKILLNM